jgi:hypothetical protein
LQLLLLLLPLLLPLPFVYCGCYSEAFLLVIVDPQGVCDRFP